MKVYLIIFVIVIVGCSSKSNDNIPNIGNEIEKTEIFKKIERKVDSLKAKGAKADIQIGIISGQQLNREDSLTKFKVALIEISILNGVDEIESYRVKYDSVSNKIQSIEREY